MTAHVAFWLGSYVLFSASLYQIVMKEQKLNAHPKGVIKYKTCS